MICSNFGRRSDKIVRSKERLARIWLYQRYRVKLFKARKSRNKTEVPCHAYRKHGPQNPLSRIKDRILQQTGEAAEYGLGKNKFSSKFNSVGLMWYARESFLDYYQGEMGRIARAIDEGQPVDATFRESILLPKPIGEGYLMKNGSVVHVSQSQRATFMYRYESGIWYEITGYPNVKRPT